MYSANSVEVGLSMNRMPPSSSGNKQMTDHENLLNHTISIWLRGLLMPITQLQGASILNIWKNN